MFREKVSLLHHFTIREIVSLPILERPLLISKINNCPLYLFVSTLSILYSVFNEQCLDFFRSLGWHNVNRRPLVHFALVSDFRIMLSLGFRLLSKSWLAQVDSNHRPRAYQARALTT